MANEEENTNMETENQGSDSTGSEETPVKKEKRTRTSPRTKALDEVIAMLVSYASDVEEDVKENSPTGANPAILETISDAILETVSDIKGRITSMLDEGSTKPTYNGRHYIGVNADGSRAGFQSNTAPNKRTHGGGTKHNYTSVLGPFRTSEGVDFRLKFTPDELKDKLVECPAIF